MYGMMRQTHARYGVTVAVMELIIRNMLYIYEFGNDQFGAHSSTSFLTCIDSIAHQNIMIFLSFTLLLWYQQFIITLVIYHI